MRKVLFCLFILLSVFSFADNINPEVDPNVIPVPSKEGTIFDQSLLPLNPGAAPTIPTLDPLHAPLLRNNFFGIDFSNWLGAEGTEVTARTTFKSKDKFYGMDTYGAKGTASMGVNYKFPTTESLGGTFYFDGEYKNYIGGGTPSMYSSAYNVYRLYFMREYYKDEKYETRLTVGHNYYDLRGDNGNDGQEFGAGLAFPELLKWGKFNLVPNAYLGYIWDLEMQNDTGIVANKFNGTVAQLGADLYFAPDPNAKNFLFDFYVKGNYNDAADLDRTPDTYGVKGKFTDITFGAAVDFELAKGIIATPTVNYIYYLDEDINSRGKQSEVWTGVTLRYNF